MAHNKPLEHTGAGNWRWIQSAAREKHLSIDDVGAFVGVSKQSVYAWTNGQKDPRTTHLYLLAVLFTNGDVNVLLDRAGLNKIDNWNKQQLKIRDLIKEKQSKPKLTLQIPQKILSTDPHADEAVLLVNQMLNNHYRYAELKAQTKAYLDRVSKLHPRLTAKMLCFQAQAELMLGNYDGSISAAERVTSVDGGTLSNELLAESYSIHADALRCKGEFAKSRDISQHALEVWETVGNPSQHEWWAWTIWNLSRLATYEGNLNFAEAKLNEAEAMFKNSNNRDGISQCIWGKASLIEQQGELCKAHQQYIHAREINRKTRNLYWVACSDWRLAETQRKIGRLNEASQLANDTAEIFKHLENNNMDATVRLVIAACHTQRGEFDQAARIYKDCFYQARADDDVSMIQHSKFNIRVVEFGKHLRKRNPDFQVFMNDVADKPKQGAGMSWVLQTYQALFSAEVLRLNRCFEQAYMRYESIANDCAESGHKLELAHALLGMAECQRITGQVDQTNAQLALRQYRAIESIRGEMHAHITLALLHPRDSGLADAHLSAAKKIADEAGCYPMEQRMIVQIRSNNKLPNTHPLLFIR
jgi:DNA-binding XRE family transcriptional regulator